MALPHPGVRVFGGTGGVSPQDSWNSARYGRDLNGNAVGTAAAYVAAASQLRSFAGHDPAQASSWTLPAPFAKYDQELGLAPSSVDVTKPSGNSFLAQIQSYQSMGIEPLAVQWTTVGPSPRRWHIPPCLKQARHALTPFASSCSVAR